MVSTGVVQRTWVLDTPRELVFQAFTDPESISRWWGPRGLSTVVDRLDVRPGGTWRFVQRTPEGAEQGFHGVYREVTPPERLVRTFEHEGLPPHLIVETVTFDNQRAGTRLTMTWLFSPVANADDELRSRTEEGAAESVERLADVLRSGQGRHAVTHVHGPDFVGIQVRDLERAVAFYEQEVGLGRAPGSPPGVVAFQTSSIPFAVREPLPGTDLDAGPAGLGVSLSLKVDDAQALHDHLKARGVPILIDPFDTPFGRTFVFQDPDRYAIAVHGASPEEES